MTEPTINPARDRALCEATSGDWGKIPFSKRLAFIKAARTGWPAALDEIERLHNLLRECADDFEQIAKGEGAFNRDPLVHASNVIEGAKKLAASRAAKISAELGEGSVGTAHAPRQEDRAALEVLAHGSEDDRISGATARRLRDLGLVTLGHDGENGVCILTDKGRAELGDGS